MNSLSYSNENGLIGFALDSALTNVVESQRPSNLCQCTLSVPRYLLRSKSLHYRSQFSFPPLPAEPMSSNRAPLLSLNITTIEPSHRKSLP